MRTAALGAVLLLAGITAHGAVGEPGDRTALPDITARVTYSGTAKQVETRPLSTQDPSKANVITTTIKWTLTWTGPLTRLTKSPRFTSQSVAGSQTSVVPAPNENQSCKFRLSTGRASTVRGVLLGETKLQLSVNVPHYAHKSPAHGEVVGTLTSGDLCLPLAGGLLQWPNVQAVIAKFNPTVAFNPQKAVPFRSWPFRASGSFATGTGPTANKIRFSLASKLTVETDRRS